MYQGYALSVRGYSHLKENIPRQDSAAVYTDPTGWAMAVVADGHGGDAYFRSHIGSRFAVEAALRAVKSCLEDKDVFIEALKTKPDDIFRRLKSSVINNWNNLITEFSADPQGFDWSQMTIPTQQPADPDAPVQDGISPEWEQSWIAEHDVKVNERRPERLYGSTLLAAVQAQEFSFALQIGDGCCVMVNHDGSSDYMIPPDEEKAANVTNSLCESDALNKFQHAFFLREAMQRDPSCAPAAEADPEEPSADQDRFVVMRGVVEQNEQPNAPAPVQLSGPVGIVLSTDGLFNSFSNPDDFMRFNCRVLSRMEPSVREAFGKELEGHLNDRSRMGSSDDISMALVYDGNMDFEAVRP